MKTPERNAQDRRAEDQRRYFLSQCRSRGLRATTQRLAVFQALSEDDGHPTADSLHTRLRKTMPSLSLSTVYRILESLENKGLVRRVGSTSGIVRYDGNHSPHQHLICRHCGGIADIEDESLARLSLPRIPFAGFVAEELDIRIIGKCAECSLPAPGSAKFSEKNTSERQGVSRNKEEK